MIRTIRIASSEEFAAFAAEPDSGQQTVVEFATDKLTLPFAGLNFRHRSGITFRGETAPSGVLTISGGAFNLIGCESVTCRSMAFRLKRPTDRTPEKYEKSWKPLRVHAEHPDRPCRNIRFESCSTSGGTDEIEVGPSDHAIWFRDWMGKPAAIGVTFDRHLFGPSLMGKMLDRERHNMGLALSCVDDVLLTGCVFTGHNRRCPQIAGNNVRLEHCAVFDWGTMGTGFHSGSTGSINACHFVRGPHTRLTERAISLVEDTFASPFGQLGYVTLAVSPNTVEYGIDWQPLRKGWNCWQEPLTTKGALWRRTAVIPLTPKPLTAIIASAGAGDSTDVAIRRELTAKRHIAWRFD